MRYVNKVLDGKAEGKRPRRIYRYRWRDNIILDLEDWDGAYTKLIWLRMRTSGVHF